MLQSITNKYQSYHQSFLKYNIDAVTITAVPTTVQQSTYNQNAITFRVIKILEGSVRSFNNLYEKLHHSTWLFMLISTKHFVTMSKYIYAFVLLGVAIPLLGFKLLYTIDNHQWLFSIVCIVLLYSCSIVLGIGPVVVDRMIGWNDMVNNTNKFV